MSTETTLSVQAGQPFTQRVRLVDGKNIWGTLGAFEVRAQVRRRRTAASELIVDLTNKLSGAFDGNDIVIDLALTGAETRELRSGFYDLIISDVGVTDARAVVLLHGAVEVAPVVTSAS